MTSKTFFSRIYKNLCESRKPKVEVYGEGSGLHRHHIIPTHAGGLDEESNYTYLTPREHQIAHYLLWKINGDVQDLRSMKMLGANLSIEYRRKIGLWCVENKIGVHGKDRDVIAEEVRRERARRLSSGEANEFDYWASEEGRRKRSSMGGKKSVEVLRAKYGGDNFSRQTKEERKRICSLGGNNSPKLPAYNVHTLETKKFYTRGDREDFIKENPNWVSGYKPSEAVTNAVKKKYPAYHEISTATASFYTKEERLEFLSNNPEWKSGRRPTPQP